MMIPPNQIPQVTPITPYEPAGWATTLKSEFYQHYLSLPEETDLGKLYGIKGKIVRSDALFLYENGCRGGDALELGCFQGLSTLVLANCMKDCSSTWQYGTMRCNHVHSVDCSMEAMSVAKKLMEKENLKRYVTFHHNDAAKQIEQFIASGQKFNLVFVDHDHRYKSVYDVCVLLPEVLNTFSTVFFHDYQDYRNNDPHSVVQVYQAVQDTIAKDNRFKFQGLCGRGASFWYNGTT